LAHEKRLEAVSDPDRSRDAATITIRQEGDTVSIEYGWPQSTARPYLFFGGILLLVALFEGIFKHATVPCTVFIMIGIGLTYNGLKLLLNKTKISADRERLLVASHPLPAGPAKRFAAAGITEIFMATPVRSQRSLVEVHPTIFLTRGDQAPERLVDAVPTAEVASHIRHTLLDFYGLPDLDSIPQNSDLP
jgi:hypothetical protein